MSKPRDDGTFIEVYDRYKTGIYHFCQKMLADSDEAKDVVQEVFIKYFENHQRLDSDTRTKVWLFKSARNRCLNYIRDRGRISNIGDGGDNLAGPALTDSERVDSSDIIIKLFDDLPIDYREILVMREWSELSYGEIAETLDTTISAVKSKLFKARKKAIEIYKKLYGDE